MRISDWSSDVCSSDLIVLASCACEPQSDLILNLESRLNDTRGDIYDGFDWACLLPDFKDDPAYTQACAVQKRYFDPADAEHNASDLPGDNFTPEAIAHMPAQEIGRASWRERIGQFVELPVVAGTSKKKKNHINT